VIECSGTLIGSAETVIECVGTMIGSRRNQRSNVAGTLIVSRRNMQISIQLRIESADGRLAEEVASQLVAVGYDGNIESIWVSEGFLPARRSAG